MARRGNNSTLSEEQKTFVVQRLACFDPPSVVIAALKEEWGVEIKAQSIEAYDPTKRAGRNAPEGRRKLFEETRATFLEKTAEIGVANRAVRLRMLERMAIKAEGMGNLALAAQLIEQAAKEVGDVYTNKRLLEGNLQVNHDHRVLAARDRIAEKRRAVIEGQARVVSDGGDGRKLDS